MTIRVNLKLNDVASSNDSLDCGVIKFNRNTGILFDRIAIINEILEKSMSAPLPIDIMNGITNSMRIVSLDYRNLKEIVKIQYNIPKKIIINLIRRTRNTWSGRPIQQTVELVVSIKVENQIAFIGVEDVILNNQFHAIATKQIKYKPAIAERLQLAKSFAVPTVDHLYKLVNSKYKIGNKLPEELLVNNNTKQAKDAPCMPASASISITMDKLVADIKLALRANTKVLFHTTKITHYTVKDVGICDMNDPLFIVLFSDNTMQVLKLREHTVESIRKYFTREVSLPF